MIASFLTQRIGPRKSVSSFIFETYILAVTAVIARELRAGTAVAAKEKNAWRKITFGHNFEDMYQKWLIVFYSLLVDRDTSIPAI